MDIIRDCQVRAPEGRQIRFDVQRAPRLSAAAWIDWIRIIRGGLLSGAFYIEQNINAMIQGFFLGSGRQDTASTDIFADVLLPSLNFDRRIQVAARIMPLLHSGSAQQISTDLGRVKALRNAVAHHSVWFDPTLDDEDYMIEITPKIIVSGKEVTLDGNQVEKWNVLVYTCVAQTAALSALAIDSSADISALRGEIPLPQTPPSGPSPPR